MDVTKYTKEYLTELKMALDVLPWGKLEEIVGILEQARNEGKHVFVFGNGGSASTASHFANDLSKGTIANDQSRFKAISLTDNIPVMLAWGNDSCFSDIFVEQLKNLLDKGDVVVGISGSGNSENVLKAIEYANNNKATTIGLTGIGGGELKTLAQHAIVVESDHMGKVEDTHMILVHLISYYFKDRQSI